MDKEINDRIREFLEKNPDLAHFGDIMRLIPIIQEKALISLDIEINEIKHDQARQEKEKMILREIVGLIRGKWLIELLYTLGFDKPRYNELKKALPGINSRTLTDRLRLLEEKGMIKREVLEESPPSVVYELTEFGTGLVSLFMTIFLYFQLYNQ